MSSDLRSAELDLRWYFEDARVFGFCSPLGIQLDMLRTGILFCQRTYCEHDAVPEQYLKDRERAIDIEAKLLHLSEHHQRVLWLAFAHGGRIGDGPTLALCSATKAAREGFLAETRSRMVKRKSKGRAVPSTIRAWVFRLAVRSKAKDGAAQREVAA